MLVAENMGWEQSRRSFLSSRRRILRRRALSCRCTFLFTRNLLTQGVLERLVTVQTPQNAKGFRVFPHFAAPGQGNLACLETSGRSCSAARGSPCSMAERIRVTSLTGSTDKV